MEYTPVTANNGLTVHQEILPRPEAGIDSEQSVIRQYQDYEKDIVRYDLENAKTVCPRAKL